MYLAETHVCLRLCDVTKAISPEMLVWFEDLSPILHLTQNAGAVGVAFGQLFPLSGGYSMGVKLRAAGMEPEQIIIVQTNTLVRFGHGSFHSGVE